MTCSRCQSSMQAHDFFAPEQRHGLMWMRGWRRGTCGYAADPLLEANRRLCLVKQALRIVPSGPSCSMLSVPWRYET